MDFARPYGRGDFALVRERSNGAYWRAADGMVVRLAMPERGRVHDRNAEAQDASDAAPWNAGGG